MRRKCAGPPEYWKRQSRDAEFSPAEIPERNLFLAMRRKAIDLPEDTGQGTIRRSSEPVCSIALGEPTKRRLLRKSSLRLDKGYPGLPHLPAQAFVDDEKTALQDGAVVLMVRLFRMALGEEGLEPALRNGS